MIWSNFKLAAVLFKLFLIIIVFFFLRFVTILGRNRVYILKLIYSRVMHVHKFILNCICVIWKWVTTDIKVQAWHSGLMSTLKSLAKPSSWHCRYWFIEMELDWSFDWNSSSPHPQSYCLPLVTMLITCDWTFRQTFQTSTMIVSFVNE